MRLTEGKTLCYIRRFVSKLLHYSYLQLLKVNGKTPCEYWAFRVVIHRFLRGSFQFFTLDVTIGHHSDNLRCKLYSENCFQLKNSLLEALNTVSNEFVLLHLTNYSLKCFWSKSENPCIAPNHGWRCFDILLWLQSKALLACISFEGKLKLKLEDESYP